MKKYLITGCAGFIGSNFVHYMLKKYPEILLVNLDKLTYAGNLENLKDVDEMIAHLLIAEGFSTVDEVALVPLSELSEIEGFDEDVASELQSRAKAFIEKRNAEFAKKSETLGIDEKLKGIEGLDQDMILTLADKGVKTIDDLGDLAADELMEMLGENVLSEVEANRIIMAARAHWFE